MSDILRQAGAIPFRHTKEGLRVLMITSRDTGRWVIPKGHVDKGFTAAEAAAQEAYEEAGIIGTTAKIPLGIFTYSKRLRNGAAKPATVEVYALHVETLLDKWPERAQRRLEWMPISEAAELVHEQGLAQLLLRLEDIETAKPAQLSPELSSGPDPRQVRLKALAK